MILPETTAVEGRLLSRVLPRMHRTSTNVGALGPKNGGATKDVVCDGTLNRLRNSVHGCRAGTKCRRVRFAAIPLKDRRGLPGRPLPYYLHSICNELTALLIQAPLPR
jgi:hypothetical protein